jgi:capsule polysaccharide export protein KpsE/RkpR
MKSSSTCCRGSRAQKDDLSLAPGKEIRMLSFLSVILRRKKAVAIAAAAGFVVSVVISLVLPARYHSLAAFIPGGVEQELSGSNSFLSRLGSFSESYATFVRVRRNYIIDYIVRSHRMADLMDERFDLKKMYGKDTIAEARRELSEKTHVNVRDEGVLEIAIEAPDAVTARDMTAACIEFTDRIIQELNVENAEMKITYLEEALARGERRRAGADSVLSEFMASKGIFQIESQAKAAFEMIGALSARMSALEVERDMLSMTMRETSPDIRRLDIEIGKLRAKIERVTDTGDSGGLFPPLADMPGLATEYLGMVAERMAQEFSLAYIRLKLEDARISANSSVSTIRVIDPPVVPERRSWPKRKQIVIILTMASVFWTCFVIVIREKISAGKAGLEGEGR